jgi:hypothetical protein
MHCYTARSVVFQHITHPLNQDISPKTNQCRPRFEALYPRLSQKDTHTQTITKTYEEAPGSLPNWGIWYWHWYCVGLYSGRHWKVNTMAPEAFIVIPLCMALGSHISKDISSTEISFYPVLCSSRHILFPFLCLCRRLSMVSGTKMGRLPKNDRCSVSCV